MRETKFDGIWTALVTPFDSNGNIDWTAFDKLVQLQVEAKVTGLVLCGTTGESSTLTTQEKLSIIRRVKANYARDILIMAGTGGSNTAQSVELSKLAVDSGADALLVVTPPYNKPTMNGLLGHYQAIAEAQPKPICLYHVPGRTAQTLKPEQIAELCKIKNVSMVKEASGDVALFSRALTQSTNTTFLTGDDPTFLGSLAVGGHGVISVFTNIFPKQAVAMYNAYKAGNTDLALKYHNAMLNFMDSMFFETNPCPAKACLAHMNLIKNHFRLPLAEVTQGTYDKVTEIYKITLENLAKISQ